MIQNLETDEVLVQNRKLIYPGLSFPGGHVEQSESIYDCAVREVKEETGLDVRNLDYCGVVHWVNRDNDDRYLCFMYKTTKFNGKLMRQCDDGESENYWFSINELLALPQEKFSSVHYCFSPLFHDYGKYSEVYILWSGDESTWETHYK
jgi:8-oxo-dGTP diphosphatase